MAKSLTEMVIVSAMSVTWHPVHDRAVGKFRWPAILEALPLLAPLDRAVDYPHLGHAVFVSQVHRANKGAIFVHDDLAIETLLSLAQHLHIVAWFFAEATELS